MLMVASLPSRTDLGLAGVLRAGCQPSDQDFDSIEQIYAARSVAGDAANLSDQLHRLLAEDPRIGTARGNGFARRDVQQEPMPALPRGSCFPALRRVPRSGTPRRTTSFDGGGILALVSLNGELAVAGRAETTERSFGVAVAASGANNIHSTSAKAMSRDWSVPAFLREERGPPKSRRRAEGHRRFRPPRFRPGGAAPRQSAAACRRTGRTRCPRVAPRAMRRHRAGEARPIRAAWSASERVRTSSSSRAAGSPSAATIREPRS